MKFTYKHIIGALIAILLLGLSACKMDMEQEIWLSKNQSGKARVFVRLNIPMAYDEESMGEMDLNQNSALKAMADKAENVKGVSITKLDTETQHSEEEMNYLYTFEFTFNDLQGLREVICKSPDKGLNLEKTKKGKTLFMDSRQFVVADEGDAESIEYLSLIEMSLKTIVHLPKKPKAIDESGSFDKKTKTATWTEVINQDWYSTTEKPMQVTF